MIVVVVVIVTVTMIVIVMVIATMLSFNPRSLEGGGGLKLTPPRFFWL